MFSFKQLAVYSTLIVSALTENVEVVPHKYIVSLKPGVNPDSIETHLNWVHGLHRRNRERRGSSEAGFERRFDIGNFHAYHGEFDDETIAEIGNNDDVYLVEPDFKGGILDIVTQTSAPYGLEGISSRAAPATSNTLGGTYRYDSSAGEGTFVYVFDTGVEITHPEFEGRAVKGFNAFADIEDDKDYAGHGTHVAGTVASKTYGVAKKANIVDVKAAYSIHSVIECLEWTVRNVTGTPGRLGKSFINMSLGFPVSQAMNAAVKAAHDAGVLSIVAAGNSNDQASNRSPAGEPSAVTVGALTFNNRRAGFSSYGYLVDIWAVGDQVVSTVPGSSTDQYSGTSMASPTIAGLVAYLRGLEGASLDSPVAMVQRLLELGTKDVITNAGQGSPNLVGFNGVSS